MSVTLKADIPQDAAFTAGAGATSSVAWTYNVTDTSGVGGVLANSPVYACRPGHLPTLVLTARVPVGNSALALTVAYTYYDVNLAVLSTGTADTFSATSASASRTIALPVAPTGARYWGVSLVLNEGVSDTNVRTNLFMNPRATSFSGYGNRNSWTATYSLWGSDIGGITGLKSYVFNQCVTAGAATYAGINLYQAPDATTPSALTSFTGIAVTAGTTVTVSAWVNCTKAVSAVLAVRFFSGTTWTAAATSGSAVALTAGTWTRISVTATVPAGATGMCGAVWVPASTTWAITDQIRVTAVLAEVANSLQDYFDGSYTSGTYSARWLSSPSTWSTSELYIPGQSRNRSVVLSAVTASSIADADEIINASLKRPLRRTVYDALNVAAPQISVGTPGLLAGQLTYLCADLEDALAIDALYQYAGTITLNTGGALDGFAHMAVEDVNLSAEKAVPGYESRWLVQVTVREIKAS